ncbi:MAG: hypothetical protein IPL60_09940 [Ardenticatenia bacterium]|nr:hypothetical protein [Ardenticatenia bacterium]
MPLPTHVVNRRGPPAALLLLLMGMSALSLTAPSTSEATSAATSLTADANTSAWRTEWGGFNRVLGIAPVAADDVWVVGSNLAHFDGAKWRAVDRRDTDAAYRAIDLFGSRDGWAVGHGFTQRLRDGRWEERLPMPDAVFFDVALTDVDEGWAVGYDSAAARPAMWRLVGGAWSELPGSAIPAVAVWMASAVDGWAVGADQLAHFDGRVWTPVVVPGVKALRAVAGSGPDDVWAGGGSEPAPGFFGPGQSLLLHFDGRSWTVVRDAAGPGIAAIALGQGRGFALGYEGELLALEGGAWRKLDARVPASRFRWARAIALIPDQGGALVGIDDGKIYHILQDEMLQLVHRSAEISAIDFTRPDEGWALGPATQNLVGIGPAWIPMALGWDGLAWTPLAADHPLAGAVDIGVLSAQDAWAVGPSGLIVHFDGRSWTRVASPTFLDLYRVRAVAPNLVLALGRGWKLIPGSLASSILLLYDGESWRVLGEWVGSLPSDVYLGDVDARGNNRVWLLFSDGLRRYDGSVWTTLAIKNPTSLAMSGPESGWVGTSNGRILQIEGDKITEALQFTGASTVYRLALDSAGGGWAVGLNGTVAHLDGDQWTVRRGLATLCNCAVPTALMGLALLNVDGIRQIWVVGSEETILQSAVAEVLAQPPIPPFNETAVPFTVMPNDTATPARTPTAVHTRPPGSRGSVWLPLLVLAAMPDPPTPLAGPTGGAATSSATGESTTTAAPSTTPTPPPATLPSVTPESGPSATALPPETPPRPTSETPPGTPIPPDFAPFGLVRLAPELRLDGSGVTVDSLAFWEAPVAEDTLLLATAKGNQRVEVWQWPFKGAELAALQDARWAGSLVNGIVVDQNQGRAYVSVSRPASTIAAFALPGLEPLGALVAGQVDLRVEPNLALLTLPDGARRLYASADDRVLVFDPADGRLLADFPTTHAVETVLADGIDQVLYLPDETRRSGVHAYHPDGRPFQRGGAVSFGGGGIFEADAEGIALYACRGQDGGDDGRGLIIVSDQKNDATDFEVFDRRSWAHLGRLQLDGVRRTDGIASTERPLPDHPAGLFAAVNDDAEVVLVGWDRILEATGLRCEARVEGRGDAGASAMTLTHRSRAPLCLRTRSPVSSPLVPMLGEAR